MDKPLVAVASLGGTITMTSNQPDGSGVQPSLNVDDLLDAAPLLGATARLATATLATMPGASLRFEDIIGAVAWADAAVEKGAHGAVLVQGTDTIEETSYLADLYWDRPEPFVVTGAMRPPQTAGADGPGNLLAAVRIASDRAARDLGVLVTMNDEIHAATRVRKTRSSGPNAFASPSFGPLGYVEEARVVFGNRPVRWSGLTRPQNPTTPRIALLETFLGDDGELIELAADAGFDGIVVNGFGVGHVSRRVAAAVEHATSACPVVFSTRTGSGTTYAGSYGFPGSESDLIAKGAIPAGWLDARKSRILLGCLVAARRTPDEIRAEFLRRGEHPGGPRLIE
ncbi:MAG: L-asparaginase [Microbacteriaceae bacterium]|nr:L-asparaginase [Microbacteriaceae bacterium]